MVQEVFRWCTEKMRHSRFVETGGFGVASELDIHFWLKWRKRCGSLYRIGGFAISSQTDVYPANSDNLLPVHRVTGMRRVERIGNVWRVVRDASPACLEG